MQNKRDIWLELRLCGFLFLNQKYFAAKRRIHCNHLIDKRVLTFNVNISSKTFRLIFIFNIS